MAERTNAKRTRQSGARGNDQASRQERRRAVRARARTRRRQPSCESHTSQREWTRRDALGILALGLLVGVSYGPAMLWGGFVWDDRVITEAPPIREGASGLWQIWFSPGALRMWEGHYWPLVYSTFWLEHKLWGFDPTGYHIVNVVLHFANVLLLWHLLARLPVPGAWIIAAVFAVHPLHVESVAWVIERKDLLSTLFYLAAFSAYIRMARDKVGYVLALGLFVLGMLCKSIVVTLPVALLIYHWWQQGRVPGAEVQRLMPFFAVGLFIAIMDASFYQDNEVISFGYSFFERVLIAARVLWFYAGKLLWPTDLAVIYPHWEVMVADPFAWGRVVAACVLAGLLYGFRNRIGRGPLAGALFFAVTLSPVLGFIDFGYMQFSFVADRYQYLAGVGVLTVLIGAVVHGVARLPGALQKGCLAVTVVALGAMGILTWQQSGIYRDKVALWRHVMAYNAVAPIAPYNLGTALGELGRLDEAEENLRRALELDPRHASALQNLASVLVRKQHHEQAVDAYRRLIEIDPRSAAAHSGMGIALYYLGRTDEALQSVDRALAIDPNFEEALINRKGMPQVKAHADAGVVLMAQGKLDEAEKHLRYVLQSDPKYTIALQNLALLHLKRQQYEDARDLYQRIVEMNPDNAGAHSGMGIALYHLGKVEDAIARLDKALTLDPTLEDARANREVMKKARK